MNGSFLVVDDTSESPPYRQIVEQIRAAIERGELQPEMPLSPVRQLAGDLGVAPNTVARAYAELQTEGWLIGDGRRGTRVASQIPRQDRHARSRALRESVERFLASLRNRGFTNDEIVEALSETKANARP
ncbi:MAG TPA: GntR family transcriptional regulator [Candidatus Cybelea sp.]|nr:GntR family transcriptional regulator [Candidatus Cybelea sp.]